jgi:pyruvate decarboxylase
MAEIQVGEYLLERLKQLGIKSVFGVPGDYELAFLDQVLKSGLHWRGNPNELVASYAADGYARINGRGALLTTFGPGELSGLCGIAGAYTEFVPVVHIVGYPSVTAQRKHMILHHTLGEGKLK